MVDIHLTVSKSLSVKQKCAVCIHDVCYIVLLAIAFLCIFARPAYAYVDPSVMTYTIQALAAVAVALSAVLGVAFRRSRKVLFRIFHIDENSNKVVEANVHLVNREGAQKANAQMGEILAQEKIYMRDKREGRLKPIGRFFSALLVTAFSVYTVFVVAPLELVAQNANDLAFSLQDVFVPVILAGLAITLVVTLILTVLRGRAFNIALSLVGGLGLCAYLQAMFMNRGMPLADGHEVIWSEFTRKMVISGAVWIAILVILIVLIVIHTRQTRTALLGIAAALIIIQTVGVVSLWGPAVQKFTDANAKTIDSIDTTREGLYDVSSKKTVVVFVLDTTDTDEIRTLRESYPETFSNLTGFTWYSNTAGSMIPTRYGIQSLLTGVRPTDTNENFKDFFYSWYQRSTFLDDVNKLGYATGIYSDSWRDEKPENKVWMQDRTMNIHPLRGIGADDQMDVLGTLRILYKAAFCRDAPWIMKPRFWYYTEDLNQRMRKDVNPDDVELSSQPYHEDDLKYYNELKHYKLRIHDEQNSNGSFRFIHLMGSHPPFHLNHNMEETQNEAEQTEDEQTRGMFKIIDTYIQDLKEIGAYDNTSIIITADHGRWYLTPEDIKTPSAPCIFYKPAQSAELDAQPMKVSDAPVWHYDILPQVLKDMGADRQTLSNYTTPLDEVKEGEDRPRYYYETLSNGKADTFIKEFVINGDANNMDNWQLTGKEWLVGDDW